MMTHMDHRHYSYLFPRHHTFGGKDQQLEQLARSERTAWRQVWLVLYKRVGLAAGVQYQLVTYV